MSSLPTKDAEGMNLGLTANKPGKEGWGGGGEFLIVPKLMSRRFVSLQFHSKCCSMV